MRSAPRPKLVGEPGKLIRTDHIPSPANIPLDSDLDQIQADLLSPRHLQQYKETKAAEDLPGLGRHYCIECAKWFETETSLVLHRKGKPHKRR